MIHTPWHWTLSCTTIPSQIAGENCTEPEISLLVFRVLFIESSQNWLSNFDFIIAPCPVLSDSAPPFHPLHLGSVPIKRYYQTKQQMPGNLRSLFAENHDIMYSLLIALELSSCVFSLFSLTKNDRLEDKSKLVCSHRS